MRLHVVSVPHTQVTKAYSWCAFTNHVRVFCNMMSDLGHEVILYAGSETEARCSELVTCITPEEQAEHFPNQIPVFDESRPEWRLFNDRAIMGLRVRARTDDYLCLIQGQAQKSIADSTPIQTVEFGVGYPGTLFDSKRIFVSRAWQNTVAGWQKTAGGADGLFYDTVIPYPFEVNEFPIGDGLGDYLLFVGRLIERKGLEIVRLVAERTGLPLVVAGFGDESLIPKGAEFVGVVEPAQRAALMGAARAVLMPTLYLEPFGAVAVEAQLCGTPAITTDFGAFPETVVQGVTGYRCHDLGEFTWAANHAGELDRTRIRADARSKFSTEVIRGRFDDYFHLLDTLHDALGWYADRERSPIHG